MPRSSDIKDAPSFIHPRHPRSEGNWTQYWGMQTSLRGRVYFSDVLYGDDAWEFANGSPKTPIPIEKQTPENYHHTHNHYQLLMCEALNYSSGANCVPIWGDGSALVSGASAWGAFFSARSAYEDETSPTLKSRPGNLTATDRDEFDCQLCGLEIDVLNAGKPGVYPNKAKHGIQIVGFGQPNSHGISIICQNFDCEPSMHRGQFETALYVQNGLHPAYGRFLVSDFDKASIGIDFNKTIFTSGAARLRMNGPNTGLVFDDGLGGEVYTGARWPGLDGKKWQTIRMAEEGLRIVSHDGVREILALDAYGGIYLSGDVYINGKKLLADVHQQSVFRRAFIAFKSLFGRIFG